MSWHCRNRGVVVSKLKEVTIKGLGVFGVCPLCNSAKCLEEISDGC